MACIRCNTTRTIVWARRSVDLASSSASCAADSVTLRAAVHLLHSFVFACSSVQALLRALPTLFFVGKLLYVAVFRAIELTSPRHSLWQ